MERKEATTNNLLETIRKEMVSIIEESSESISVEKEETAHKVALPSINPFLNNCNTSNIEADLQKLQYNLDDTCKLFQTIGECFENINFGRLRTRIKDLHLYEQNAVSIQAIVNDLKHSFDEQYMENRLNDLTKTVTSKFRNLSGEFGDIPEIGDFFRTCSKLENGLSKLRKHRYDCIDLRNRITRVAEASYDRVNEIQQNIVKNLKQNTQYED